MRIFWNLVKSYLLRISIHRLRLIPLMRARDMEARDMEVKLLWWLGEAVERVAGVKIVDRLWEGIRLQGNAGSQMQVLEFHLLAVDVLSKSGYRKKTRI